MLYQNLYFMNEITLTDLNWMNVSAYVLALLFLIFLTHATLKVIRRNREIKKNKKRHKQFLKEEKKMRKLGFKPFKFNQGKTVVWAKDFKAATAQYQASLKNGM